MMTCPGCGGQLDVSIDLDVIGERINNRASFLQLQASHPDDMWAYHDFLPLLDRKHVVSLGEGMTPLLESKRLGQSLGLDKVSFKVETGNPTGSFKDRQVSMGISKAIEMGTRGVLTVSSGNVGAAVSAYAARAGMPAAVLVPSISPANKVAQIQAYGASMVRVDSPSTTNIMKAVAPFCEKHGFANLMTASPVNPYINHGAKTMAYEIAHEFLSRHAGSRDAPDVIVSPVGGGGLIAMVYRGMKDLATLDVIDHVPRFIGVQPAGCAPFANAIFDNTDPGAVFEHPWTDINTVATALADDIPLDARLALPAVRESNGTACIVDDDHILAAEKRLASMEGIFAEPSSATTVAALEQLAASGSLDKDESIVLLITGSGFKDMDACRWFTPQARTVPLSNDWDGELASIIKKGRAV